MNNDLSLLSPELKIRAESVINICKEDFNLNIVIYSTLRTLEEQAKLFRQGRNKQQIMKKVNELKNYGYGFLGDIILKVGPQEGIKVTNSPPGGSWHNFGEAFDAAPFIDGKIDWNDLSKFDLYGKAVIKAGLVWGGNWPNFKDRPHAQLRLENNTFRVYNPDQMKKALGLS